MTGTCAPCGATLDAEQRYCLACGARRAGAPALWPEEGLFGAPAAARVAAPMRRSRAPRRPTSTTAGILSAGVLASGVLVGIGIGPVALGVTEAAQRALVLIVPGAHRASTPPATPAVALAAPRGAAPAGDSSGGSSGDAAPAAAPASVPDAVTPATTTPATTPAATTPATTTTPATPATPSGPRVPVHGTVVHQNTFAGSFVLADADGKLRAVHADTLPPLGTVLHVKARALFDGTWADDDALPAHPSSATTATAKGTVTYLDPKGAFYVLSARGTSFVVHRAAAAARSAATVPDPVLTTPDPTITTPPPTTTTPDPTTTTPPSTTTTPDPTITTPPPTTTTTTTTTTTPPTPPPLGPPTTDLPAVGDGLVTKLTLDPGAHADDPGTATEVSHRVGTTPPVPPWDVESAIVKIDAKAHRLVLSADDSQVEKRATIDVTVPKAFRLDLLAPFESVAARVKPAEDGSLALTGVTADSGADTANDPANADGDLATRP